VAIYAIRRPPLCHSLLQETAQLSAFHEPHDCFSNERRLIKTERGNIRVIGMALIETANGCYGAPGREYRRLIPKRKKASSELRDIYSF
jgi:hypothetical protein